jgi:ketosteroid isomerase-like protein
MVMSFPVERWSPSSDDRNRLTATALALRDERQLPRETGILGLVASANLELVRSIYAAWERGDFRSVEWAHPEIEYVHADGPSPGSWTGLPGLAEGWRGWLGAWEELRVQVEEYRELDEERVRDSPLDGAWQDERNGLGADEGEVSGLLHVRNGRVTRFVTYFDHKNALDDLGLASEDGSRPS